MKKLFYGLVVVSLSLPVVGIPIAQPTLAQVQPAAAEITELQKLMKQAIQYIQQDQPEQAIANFQQALIIARSLSLKKAEADALSGIGAVYIKTGRLQQAIEYFNQTLPLFRAIGDKAGEAKMIVAIGTVYVNTGQLQQALEYFNRALPLFRAIGNKAEEVRMLIGIGEISKQSGQKQQALENFTQVLSILRSTGDRSGEAKMLVAIGAIYADTQQKQQALQYFNQALPLFRSVGNKAGEAASLAGIGAVYADTGRWQQALQYFNQASSLFKATGDQAGQATVLNAIGSTYNSLGEWQQALEYFNQALPLFKAMGDQAGQAHTLSGIGEVYADSGQMQQALEYFNQALPLFKATGNQAGEAAMLNGIGKYYFGTGQLKQALQYFNQALSLFKATGDQAGEANTLSNIALVYIPSGQFQQAREYLNEALPILQSVGDRAGEANILVGFAFLEDSQGNLQSALTHIEAAIKILETLRSEIISPQLRTSYFASKQDFYRIHVNLLMQLHKQQPSQGYNARALHASERARARALLELLNEANADIRQGVDPKLLEQERSLQQQLSALEKRRIQVLSGSHTPEQATDLEREYTTLLNQYQQVQDQIRLTSPRYAALTQPKPLTLAEIQQQVLDENTLLLEYSLGTNRSYLWAVTKNGMNSYELPKAAEIEQLVSQLRPLLTDTTKKYNIIREDLAQISTKLSQMLLGPVAEQLGQKRLVIVSDGALQYIPFAALPVPQSASSAATTAPPLLMNHEIVNLPSASTLAVLRRENRGRNPAPKTIAILADPVYSKDDSRLKTPSTISSLQSPSLEQSALTRSAAETGVTFRRLENTRLEAEAILKLVPADQSLAAFDFAANLSNATSSQLAQYRIVHFGTHGLLNSETPALSGVVLSLVNEKGETENGFLRLQEIFNLDLPADLVVLSACQTGLGKEIQGEGLVGLTRGFMYAGAPRVVVSLWNVDDQATALLMSEFYRGILEKQLSPPVALRQAQQALMQQEQYQAPYYWAAFTLQGEWK